MMSDEDIAAARARLLREEVEAVAKRSGLTQWKRVQLAGADVAPVFNALVEQYGEEVMLSVHICRIAKMVKEVRDRSPQLGEALQKSVIGALSEVFRTGELQCYIVVEKTRNE